MRMKNETELEKRQGPCLLRSHSVRTEWVVTVLLGPACRNMFISQCWPCPCFNLTPESPHLLVGGLWYQGEKSSLALIQFRYKLTPITCPLSDLELSLSVCPSFLHSYRAMEASYGPHKPAEVSGRRQVPGWCYVNLVKWTSLVGWRIVTEASLESLRLPRSHPCWDGGSAV